MTKTQKKKERKRENETIVQYRYNIVNSCPCPCKKAIVWPFRILNALPRSARQAELLPDRSIPTPQYAYAYAPHHIYAFINVCIHTPPPYRGELVRLGWKLSLCTLKLLILLPELALPPSRPSSSKLFPFFLPSRPARTGSRYRSRA
jgi:hypothetical protein